ncbi:BnaCnng69520D [Brassica napus]|uniref:BnaCnng69520D protein n=1 Tax=Brassica napus TaxID=3708 RepID=A0A078JYV2_BRANA|nr:BnaCnng69520D [Brassica napus]
MMSDQLVGEKILTPKAVGSGKEAEEEAAPAPPQQLKGEIFLLCFDFTKERGGDDEQLAVLFGGYESGFFEIWVTLTVDPNRASWSKFLRVETGPFGSYGFELCTPRSGGSFFVDEENKVAVLFELFQLTGTRTVHKAFVFGQEGCLKSSVYLGEALILENRNPITNNIRHAARPPLVCSSPYRPSLVQVNHPLVHKRKRMFPSAAQRSSVVKLSKRMSPPAQ